MKDPATLSDEDFQKAFNYLELWYIDLSKDDQNELKKAQENYNKRKK
jgi:hypothetical protein